MSALESIFIAISLCADCFAVSLCSSVTIRRVSWRNIAVVALSFAIIQSGLLLAGWLLGNIFVGLVEKVAHIIGFVLLLYVGGSLLVEGIGGRKDCHDLNGLKNILIGGVATSIDAIAVGVSQSMSDRQWNSFVPLLADVFIVTAFTVVCGILGGKTIGSKVGRWAEIAGGIVLISIGFNVLLG